MKKPLEKLNIFDQEKKWKLDSIRVLKLAKEQEAKKLKK